MPPDAMDATTQKADAVKSMFTAIARRYDFLNHFLSFGIDILWRKEAVRKLGPLAGKKIYDIACGTGDLSIQIAQSEPTVTVVGEDFSEGMVAIAGPKVTARQLDDRITIGMGDALCMTYPDNTFDGITCAFGVRNFADLQKGLGEMVRVIKPGTPLVILEFTQPKNVFFSFIYRLYFTKILPILGGLVSGKKSAYQYLPDTVYAFPTPPQLSGKLESAGLEKVTFTPLTFGICGLHVGLKRSDASTVS
jgi:demethylmenaquinone methyltransferase/2-methoxy-6-polyprenyl-1,4-benzoquinol methylase